MKSCLDRQTTERMPVKFPERYAPMKSTLLPPVAAGLLAVLPAAAQFDTLTPILPTPGDGLFGFEPVPVFFPTDTIPIEMVDLSLTSISPLSLPANLPVDSFFDVFFQIDLGTVHVVPGGPVAPGMYPVTGQGRMQGSTSADPLEPVRLFETELLQLNLVIGGVGLLRESPTQPSLGQLLLSDLGGGTFRIDSFFDVFTEISLDGGNVWVPQSGGPQTFTNLPEPGTWAAIVALGWLGLWQVTRRGLARR